MARSDQTLRSSLGLYGSFREILDEVVLSDIFLAFYSLISFSLFFDYVIDADFGEWGAYGSFGIY